MLYGMEMDPQMRQAQEPPKTPLLDHLGQSRTKYSDFRENFVDYLTDPAGGNKFLIIAGRTGEGKTRFAIENAVSTLADERIRAFQDHHGFVYEPDISNIGQHIEAATRVRLVKHKKGHYTTGEYRASSWNTANIMRLSLGVPRRVGKPYRTRILHIYDTVATTGFLDEGEIIGVNRGLDWALEIARLGAFCVVMFAQGDWKKKLELREAIKKAKLRDIGRILAANNIIDTRPSRDTRQYYRESGNLVTRFQQDTDIRYVMYKLILKKDRYKRLPYPDFEVTAPRSFREHYEDAETYMRDYYLPAWLRMLYGQDYSRGYILTNEMLPSLSQVEGHKNINAFGAELEKYSLLPMGNYPGKLDLLTRNTARRPEILQLRAALLSLGAIKKRRKAA